MLQLQTHIPTASEPLWFEVAGQVTSSVAPLVFLHGGPGLNSYAFQHSVGPALEQRLAVVYLDQRGCGRSTRPTDGEYGISTLIGDIEQLRQVLCVEKISLLGHSFGGVLALEFAARHPERVEKVIVMNCSSDMPAAFALWQQRLQSLHPEMWSATMQGPAGPALEAAESKGDPCATAKLRAGLIMQTVGRVGPAAFRAAQQFHLPATAERLQALDLRSGLQVNGEMMQSYFSPGNDFLCWRFQAAKNITAPTLVLAGLFDGTVPQEMLQSLTESIGGATFFLFEQSAHWPFLEQPELFVDTVTAFLQA